MKPGKLRAGSLANPATVRPARWPSRNGTHVRVVGGSRPAQNRVDLVATTCNCPSRDGAAPFVRREIVMGNRGPRRTLIRQQIDAERRGEAMQFVDVVGPANAPIAGPASAKSHHPRKAPRPARCVAPSPERLRASESALPPGKFARPPNLHRSAGDAKGTRLGTTAYNRCCAGARNLPPDIIVEIVELFLLLDFLPTQLLY